MCCQETNMNGEWLLAKTSPRLTHADRVFTFMQQSHKPLTAYEILEGLRDDGVTAATTVYRALEKLQDSGRIHRLESLNAWTACAHPSHGQEAVFEICEDCGHVEEHVDPAIASSILAIERRSGFVTRRSVIEVHGLCSDCNAGETLTLTP